MFAACSGVLAGKFATAATAVLAERLYLLLFAVQVACCSLNREQPATALLRTSSSYGLVVIAISRLSTSIMNTDCPDQVHVCSNCACLASD